MSKVILKTVKRETTISRGAVRNAIADVYKLRGTQNDSAPEKNSHIKAETKKA